MSLPIRPVDAADLPHLVAIYAHHVAHGRASFELEPPDAAEMARRQSVLAAAGHPCLVAAEAGEVLGFCYAGPYRLRPAYRHTVEDSIYLRPEAAGRGIGRRLLAALLQAAEARGFRQMVAVIGDSANAASIGLHAALGFEPVGVLRAVGHKHGEWVDSVLMQRALGAGASSPPGRVAAGAPGQVPAGAPARLAA